MSILENYGGSWIINMEKEHEVYLKKVKRNKWKIGIIRMIEEIEKQGKTKLIKNAIKISNFLLKFHIDIRRKIFRFINKK